MSNEIFPNTYSTRGNTQNSTFSYEYGHQYCLNGSRRATNSHLSAYSRDPISHNNVAQSPTKGRLLGIFRQFRRNQTKLLHQRPVHEF